MPFHYLALAGAIVFEVIGTTALAASEQLTRFWPSVIVVVGYVLSFYLMGLTLKYMPVGIVYAIWSGMGVVLIAIVGLLVFGQKLDFPAVMGIVLIISGVVVINLFSNATHT